MAVVYKRNWNKLSLKIDIKLSLNIPKNIIDTTFRRQLVTKMQ